MVMVSADGSSQSRRTLSPSGSAWSEGWRPPGAQSAFIKWSEWTLAMTVSHDDSTINTDIVLLLLLLLHYNCFTTLCSGLPRWVGARRINHSGFCWSRHGGVAVASAEPYASYLHFAPEDNHTSTSSLRFLRAGCPSWHPTNSVN